MSSHDLYLLAPEISLAALAAILVLVDLVVRKRLCCQFWQCSASPCPSFSA